MDYSKRWHVIYQLGEGGQGKAYKVIDLKEYKLFDISAQRFEKLFLTSEDETEGNKAISLYQLRNLIWDVIDKENEPKEYVLKEMHDYKRTSDYEKAQARIRHEIEAIKSVGHPNLIHIIDSDADFTWYVTDFYSKGTLTKNIGNFRGNIALTLSTFIPLVEAVIRLHKSGLVHRDIKPDNIFIDTEDNLILGDFGLIYYSDHKRTRISETLENVGSRDWMPIWAQGAFIDQIKPTFDIFCLGKVLWSMISGKRFLRAWYFDKPEFNVENLLPDCPSIGLINPLLKKCIVENEEDCLPSVDDLLSELKSLQLAVSAGGEKLGPARKRRCKICGIGHYIPGANRNPDSIRRFGLSPQEPTTFRIMICEHCGHVQLFLSYTSGNDFDAWKE